MGGYQARYIYIIGWWGHIGRGRILVLRVDASYIMCGCMVASKWQLLCKGLAQPRQPHSLRIGPQQKPRNEAKERPRP